ncbi:hypothetical protein DSO57_1008966 [Entomophthora muscae]|uniref:Uncharacterized protein n=2 Tax=Entomophthora muscae TaxID=34485 RepID=A0ACC2SVQ4_9FUNG|nr:hypothetical protein DSO57_1008966 [Entomophthora muscae]
MSGGFNFQYDLEILQHPDRARMCGFGDKDRRPIDPPPVLKLISNSQTHAAEMACQKFVVFCDIFGVQENHPDLPPTEEPMSLVSQQSTEQMVPNLVGTTAATAHYFKSIDPQQEAILFVFPELSVRIEGTFRLRFTLFPGIGDESCIHSSVIKFSKPFRSYSPKNFPGMLASSELSKSLANQGIKINTRSGSDPNIIVPDTNPSD